MTVRIFLAPAEAAEDRRAWIEMDKFEHALAPGANEIERPGRLASPVRKPAERPPVFVQGPAQTPHEQYCRCGWPYHLLIPRGTVAGMPFRVLVMLTDWEQDRVSGDDHCGSMSFCGARDRYPDRREMGYPFSRPIPGGHRGDARGVTERPRPRPHDPPRPAPAGLSHGRARRPAAPLHPAAALRLQRAVLRRQPGAVDGEPRQRAAAHRRRPDRPRARPHARLPRRGDLLGRPQGREGRLHRRPQARLPPPVRRAARRAPRAQEPRLRPRGRGRRAPVAAVLALVLLQRLLARARRRPARGRLGDGPAADARRRAGHRRLRAAHARGEAAVERGQDASTATRSSSSPAARTPPTSRPASTRPRPGTTSPTASARAPT